MRKQNTKLLVKINSKRDEMMRLGMIKGLTCKETVKVSQELDELLNMYREVKEEKTISTIAV